MSQESVAVINGWCLLIFLVSDFSSVAFKLIPDHLTIIAVSFSRSASCFDFRF